MDKISFPKQDLTTNVTVARSIVAKALGLSFRRSIGSGGMLFPMKGRSASIWMMGMRFPIDVLWIANGKVVKIDHDVEPPRHWLMSALVPYTLPRYTCDERVDYILELPAGYCRTNNVDSGDAVDVGVHINDIGGQASVSYMLVVAVLAIAIGGMLSSETLRSAFSHLFGIMAGRIMGPH